MEHKHLLSALGVGIGVGVGLGLASGQSLSRWTGSDAYSQSITADKLEQEMMRLVVDGKDTGVTFDDFPYFLSEQTRVLLTSAAFVQLKQAELSKHTRYLSPASRTILLSGSAELYQQTLAKALAHCFDSKFLLLDVTDFCLKIQSKYGSNNKGTAIKRSLSVETLERFSGLVGSFPTLAARDKDKGGLRRQRSGADIVGLQNSSSCIGHRRNFSASDNIDSLSISQSSSNPVYPRCTRSWPFDEKALMLAFYGVIVSVSKSSPMVVYLRDVETFLSRSQRVYVMFQKILKKISGPVLILGSQSLQSINENLEMNERLSAIFPYNLEIKPPKDEAHLISWKSQLEEDIKIVQFQDNQNHIKEVLASSDLDCDELDSICVDDSVVLSNHIEEIMVSAISYHLTNNKDPIYRNGKLLISSKSLSHGLCIFQDIRSKGNLSLKFDKTHIPEQSKVEEESAILKPSKKNDVSSVNNNQGKDLTSITKADCEPSLPPAKILEAAPDNEFEKRIRPEVILSKDISVTFSDIGAMDEIKESLQELVMLPLRRPDLFIGGLLKPCRGILLFGPPGTGKTMMAKAIAKEAGASFINVSMSTIASKWFGEDEKNVRALFTLAAKVSPTIIFVDEVDSMLGQRNRAGEHEAMRKIKNEFMIHWDGLLTRPGEQILVLAATNRPFDLDEAIIRRFERRILIGLPSTENRKMIFKTLLSKAQISESIEFGELAAITEGYSGSDIKNLCTTAAYRPVRELIQQERLKDLEKKRRAAEIQGVENLHEKKVVIKLRPLNMADFRQAKNEVAASFSAESSIMGELKQWNELYGEGGSRKKQQLTYFL